MTATDRWYALVVASSVVALVAAIAGTGDARSMVPLLWFLAVVPGLPFVRMLHNREDPVAFWLTAIGLSIALDALVAEALLYLDAYSATSVVFALGVIACLGAGIDRFRTFSRDPEPADPRRASS